MSKFLTCVSGFHRVLLSLADCCRGRGRDGEPRSSQTSEGVRAGVWMPPSRFSVHGQKEALLIRHLYIFID